MFSANVSTAAGIRKPARLSCALRRTRFAPGPLTRFWSRELRDP